MIEREGGHDIEKKHEATVMGIMQKMSQNNYIIFHSSLIVKLDLIVVAL
jgi:hypothetical protein